MRTVDDDNFGLFIQSLLKCLEVDVPLVVVIRHNSILYFL
jgi:hypothetical protein